MQVLFAGADGNRNGPPTLAGALVLKISAAWFGSWHPMAKQVSEQHLCQGTIRSSCCSCRSPTCLANPLATPLASRRRRPFGPIPVRGRSGQLVVLEDPTDLISPQLQEPIPVPVGEDLLRTGRPLSEQLLVLVGKLVTDPLQGTHLGTHLNRLACLHIRRLLAVAAKLRHGRSSSFDPL